MESNITKYEEAITSILKDWCLDDKYDYLYQLMFGKPYQVWSLFIDKDGKIEIDSFVERLFIKSLTDYKFIDLNFFIKELNKNAEFSRTFISANGSDAILYIYKEVLVLVYYISEYSKELIVYSATKPTILESFIKPIEDSNNKDAEFTYITQNTKGLFDSTVLTVKHNLNISLDNYNDDLPYDKMVEFCDSESSGLMLFSGPCGTGKTTIIKKLIHDCKQQFILLTADTLMNIDSTAFMTFLIKKGANSVLVLEDCDTLLKSRDLGGNSAISALLNLSDGILGDALNLKFICTYNTNESNIDKALLRKGRLKLKYIFNKLTADKVHKLRPEFNKPMTLAEIYNTEDNDFSAKKSSKLGF